MQLTPLKRIGMTYKIKRQSLSQILPTSFVPEFAVRIESPIRQPWRNAEQ
jgi:hypothetical protein